MFKKLLSLLILGTLFFSFSSLAFAQGTSKTEQTLRQEQGQLLKKPADLFKTDKSNTSLPEGSFDSFISSFIKIGVQVAGAIALITFVVIGVMFVSARGSQEEIDKAKEVLFYAIIGLVFIAISYAVVLGISRLFPEIITLE